MTVERAAELLGVPAGAPVADVQRAYFRAARSVHPDAMPDATDAERAAAALRFDELSRARGVLLTAGPASAGSTAVRTPSPAGVPRAPSAYRREGLGGSLLVLLLLVFLLVSLVSLNDAFRLSTVVPRDTTTPAVTPTP